MTTVIQRFRGDTVPDKVLCKHADGSVRDITGYTLALAVNRERNPVDDTNQLFSLPGIIVNPTAGEVWFAPSPTQANQAPGKYYFDVQLIDGSGYKETILKGTYRFLQDINKT